MNARLAAPLPALVLIALVSGCVTAPPAASRAPVFHARRSLAARRAESSLMAEFRLAVTQEAPQRAARGPPSASSRVRREKWRSSLRVT